MKVLPFSPPTPETHVRLRMFPGKLPGVKPFRSGSPLFCRGGNTCFCLGESPASLRRKRQLPVAETDPSPGEKKAKVYRHGRR